MTRRTVLIIHPGTLGDVLLARPAMQAVQAAYPHHELGLLAGGEIGRLLKTCGEAVETFSLESGHLAALLAGPESVEDPLRRWLSRCDLAVCWMADPDGSLAGALRSVGVTKVTVCSPNSVQGTVHQTTRFLETVRGIAQAEAGHWMTLRLPEEIRAAGDARLTALGCGNPPVVVHPGSGSPYKCTEPAMLARAVDRLRTFGYVPLLIGGPADDGRLGQTAEACSCRPLTLQHMDILSAAGVLASGAVFIGHDSGLTHLAAAIGLPTVALFGPTDADRWRPLGSHVKVVRGGPCRCPGWEQVRTCGEKPCLQIDVNELLAACRSLLHVRRDSVA